MTISKHSHSHCKVKRSQLLSQLDKVSGEQEQAVFTNRVLYSRVVMETLGMASEGYRVYQETEIERAAEGNMAAYRLAKQKRVEL